MVNKEDLIKSAGTPSPETEKPLVFATDSDITAVLDEMDQSKQQFDRPQQTEESELFEVEEKVVSPAQKHRINQTSEFVVTYIDKSIATALAVWAKTNDTKQFEADPEDIDELATYWGTYFQDQEIALPPWIMAAIVTVIVLSKKVNHAIHIRKLNIELAAEKEITKNLNDQINKLKKEKELETLQSQVDKLKGERK